jgi:hypothetical protein
MEKFVVRSIVRRTAQTFLLSLVAFAATEAQAVDTQPFDFVPAPAGTNLALAYYAYGDSSEYISASGNKVNGSSLQSNIMIARYVHYFDFFGMTADINFLQPFGAFNDVKIGGRPLTHNDFDIGNTTLIFTIWPINDAERQIYFGIANYLIVANGSYDVRKSINLGDNRWSFVIQPAFHAKLYDKVSIDLVGDVSFYGDNNDASPSGGQLSQEPSFSVQAWLNYNFTPTIAASIGMSHLYNGEQKLDGVSLSDGHVTKIKAALSTFVTPTTQVLLQIDHDVSVENSFSQEFGATLRLMTVF